jgi:hypothetical protein
MTDAAAPDPPDKTELTKEDAARLLAQQFVANAAGGDNAANDDLVEEMLRRARARRSST